MSSTQHETLTGSETIRPATHAAPVSAALSRVRVSVLIACWVLGIALLLQTVIASLAYFTDVRWTELQPQQQTPLIITADDTARQSVPSSLDAGVTPPPSRQPVNANRVLSLFDRMFSMTSAIAAGFGRLSVLVLIPLIGLGVLVATNTATRGVEDAVSSFMWALIVALLVLPIGPQLGLTWHEGALWSYGALVDQVETLRSAGPDVEGRLTAIVFFARYLVLPLTSIVGLTLTGLRFSAGVELGLAPDEDLRLDRVLEREAGNIKVGSLHAPGRVAGAIPGSVGGEAPVPPEEVPVRPKRLAAGELPKRLI